MRLKRRDLAVDGLELFEFQTNSREVEADDADVVRSGSGPFQTNSREVEALCSGVVSGVASTARFRRTLVRLKPTILRSDRASMSMVSDELS